MTVATFNSPVTLPWPYILQFGGSSAELTVATFGDLPAGEEWQQVFVLDNGFSGAAGVIYISGQWVVTITSLTDILDLPIDGVWSASPSVVSSSGYTMVSGFGGIDALAIWNNGLAAWQYYTFPTSAAAFSDLPSLGINNQLSTVEENGFHYTMTVKYSNSLVSWYAVETTVGSSADLPADGVWNVSPAVISATNVTLAKKADNTEVWLWNGATWTSFT